MLNLPSCIVSVSSKTISTALVTLGSFHVIAFTELGFLENFWTGLDKSRFSCFSKFFKVPVLAQGFIAMILFFKGLSHLICSLFYSRRSIIQTPYNTNSRYIELKSVSLGLIKEFLA